MTSRITFGSFRAGIPIVGGGGDPDPDPTTFDHGNEVTRDNVGYLGDLEDLTPVDFITTSSTGQTFSNLLISGGMRIRHEGITIQNCVLLGSIGANTQTLRHNEFPYMLRVLNTTIATQDVQSKGFNSNGNGAMTYMKRVLIIGGEDNVFLKPTGGAFGTASGDNAGYQSYFEECWFGMVMREEGTHTDVFQIDGGDGGVWLNRCNIRSFCIPNLSNPLELPAPTEDLENSGGGGFIVTAQGVSPLATDNVKITDSDFNGSTAYTQRTAHSGADPTNGPNIIVTGNTFGRVFGSAPMLNEGTATETGNTFLDNGDPVETA